MNLEIRPGPAVFLIVLWFLGVLPLAFATSRALRHLNRDEEEAGRLPQEDPESRSRMGKDEWRSS
jgi:hypothetical protein